MLLPVTLHEFNASFSSSSTSLLLSATLALLALFLLLRLAVFLRKCKVAVVESSKAVQPAVSQEKAPQGLSTYRTARQFLSSFALPISLKTIETKSEIGKGPGIRSIAAASAAFRAPEKPENTSPPSPYDTRVPASAAKLIMSRHTFRKAVPGAPRRPVSASRLPLTQSMV